MWEAIVLRQIMSDFHISGAELSRQSGVSYQQISKFRGGNEISRANFVKIVKALPEKARRVYLNLVFDLTFDSESDFTLNALKLRCQIQQLAESLQIELEESSPSSKADHIAALQAQIDDLSELLSKKKNQD